MSNPVFESIVRMLDEHGIRYEVKHHAPTLTSEDSARERGTPLEWGGKSILFKVGQSFKIFVFSAARALDSLAIKKYFHEKDRRFATRDELKGFTGLESGSVPPFGHPILLFDLFVDTSITKNDKIAFNAGSLTDSVIMDTKDYLEIAKPTVFDFTEEKKA